jgi:cobalamin biosynthesis Mg chelatase CobN
LAHSRTSNAPSQAHEVERTEANPMPFVLLALLLVLAVAVLLLSVFFVVRRWL